MNLCLAYSIFLLKSRQNSDFFLLLKGQKGDRIGKDKIFQNKIMRLIKKDQSKIVDSGSKIIKKYTAQDKQLEINYMTLNGKEKFELEIK